MRGLRPAVASCLLALLLPALAVQGNAQGSAAPEITYTAAVHWVEEILRIETTVTPRGERGVITTLDAERAAAGNLSDRTLNAVYNVQLSSQATVGEYLEENQDLAAEVGNTVAEPPLTQRFPTEDLESVQLRHEVPLYPTLIDAFVRHGTTQEPPRHLGWVPTREFTGIVIYAAMSLPVHGTDRTDLAQPALLPEIFDTSAGMRRIVGPEMVEPARLREWGVAAYTNSPDETPFQDRIGPTPLRIRATGVFGIYPTDLIIHEEDANLILATEANRRLIREGRILIILNEQVTSRTVARN
jgi:hypothetical protein